MEEANQSLGEPLQEYFGSIGVKTMQDFTLLTVSAFVQRQLASALTPVSTAQEADINAIPGSSTWSRRGKTRIPDCGCGRTDCCNSTAWC